MKQFSQLLLLPRAAGELGFRQTFWYGVYQAGLRSGLYRRLTPRGSYQPLAVQIAPHFHLPDRAQLAGLIGSGAADLINEADEIKRGQVRLFGGPAVDLRLAPPDTSRHWTDYEANPAAWGVTDIKDLWEPARFGWVYPLGRAYALTGDETYPEAFWQHLDAFINANPPNSGPNWSSGQEVALRLLALLFAAQVFKNSPHSTPANQACLAGVLAAHARRIPPTLSYARAQNNNHLISEALGLYAAGCALDGHPEAEHWRGLGWRELNQALQAQIEPDGVYAQHSLNYHRLMLHLALQADLLGQAFPEKTRQRLCAAAGWLIAQVDPHSGRAPNLGSNDGAHILPLACGGFADYRPVAQAAARAFLGWPVLPPGPWDELGLWLNQPLTPMQPDGSPLESSAVFRLFDPSEGGSWATLRAATFKSRPSHADQLHVDLWWRGENIALDAGTFRYTAAPPWDNALAQTGVHNTVQVDGQNQMRRAGRFLWLDWAQADRLISTHRPAEAVSAQHNGYRRLGIIHRRNLQLTTPGHWQVVDYLLPDPRIGSKHPSITHARLQWLLPDWPWRLENTTLILAHPGGGTVRLTLSPDLLNSPLAKVENISLVRAGKSLAGGAPADPIQGWVSPTYAVKHPALAFTLSLQAPLPFTLLSDWWLNEGHPS